MNKDISLLDRTDITWDESNLTFANKVEDLSLFNALKDVNTSNQRKNEIFDMFLKVKNLDKVILETIVDLHKRAIAVGGMTSQISAQIEILRFVRNTALEQTYEQGKMDEKLYLISKD